MVRMQSLNRIVGRGWATIAVLALLVMVGLPAAGQFGGAQLTPRVALNTAQLTAGGQHVLAVTVDVPEGLHAQSNTPSSDLYIKFELLMNPPPAGVRVFAPIYPVGLDKTYPELGNLNVYEGTVTVFVPVVVDGGATGPVTLTGTLRAQLCDDRVCFAPQEVRFDLTADVLPVGSATTPANAAVFAGFDFSVFARLDLMTAAAPAQADGVAVDFFGYKLGTLATGGGVGTYVPVFGLALLVGLLFNLMPCVLPVLPLKAVGFYEVSQHNRAKSLYLGAVFSAGMVALFAVMGGLIVLGGQQWGQMFSQGWFVWSITVVLVVAALSQFGLFEVVLPVSVYNMQPRHDTVAGNFLFGGFTAILSAPCTAPMLPAITAWAVKQPAAVGMLSIMAIGLGMALPYLVLSAMPELARKLPRTGPWNLLLKQMMGFAILAMVPFFLTSKRLPDGVSVPWLIAAVVVVAAVYLIVQTLRLMPRAVPITVAAILAVVMIGTSTSLAAYFSRPTVNWTYFSDESLATAKASGRPILIKFTADWCANCHVVERVVFGDPKTAEVLARHDVVVMKADLTQSDAAGWPLLRELSPGGGIPFTVVYTPDGQIAAKLESIYTTDALAAALARLK